MLSVSTIASAVRFFSLKISMRWLLNVNFNRVAQVKFQFFWLSLNFDFQDLDGF